jgi:hypothetical protein
LNADKIDVNNLERGFVGHMTDPAIYVRTFVHFMNPIEWRKIHFFIFG